MAKPTVSEGGTNNCRPTPTMKNDGTKTERTHSIASRRGIAVLRDASTTARAREIASLRCAWMFSTVASSTSTPTASASPPRVMMFTVWLTAHNQTTAESSAKGIVVITMNEPAPVAQK